MYDKQHLARMMRNEADMAYKRRARIFLDMLDIQPGENVFECGCGLGFNLFLLSQLFQCHLTGLDLNEARLRRAQNELKTLPVNLTLGNGYTLPFASNAFDKILMPEVLEHLDDDYAALVEIKRLLRPGGTFVITVPHQNYPFWWDPINKTREFFQRAPITTGTWGGIWTNHVRLYRPAQLRAVVERAGFQVDDVRLETHYCFPFAHNLVYGLGKPLVESGVLANAARFRFDALNDNPFNLVRLGLNVFNWIDRFNDHTGNKLTYLSLILKAVKPT